MSLPKLPDGSACLGRGRSFKTGNNYFPGWRFCAADGDTEWKYYTEWSGSNPLAYYAAPAGSEIARLNGHVGEPAKPACDIEAVALVRKLHEQLSKRLDGDEWVWQDAMAVRAEAEAFLAREGTK